MVIIDQEENTEVVAEVAIDQKVKTTKDSKPLKMAMHQLEEEAEVLTELEVTATTNQEVNTEETTEEEVTVKLEEDIEETTMKTEVEVIKDMLTKDKSMLKVHK